MSTDLPPTVSSPLSLVGMMGAGKSTIGKALAHALGWHLWDLDHEIVVASGAPSIAAIFAESGEDGFRRLERSTLARVLASSAPSVIATGGGTPAYGDGMALIEAAGPSVWLRAPLSLAAERAFLQGGRPLLAACDSVEDVVAKVRDLAVRREQFYAQAWLTIDVERDVGPERVAAEILHRLQERPWAVGVAHDE